MVTIISRGDHEMNNNDSGGPSHGQAENHWKSDHVRNMSKDPRYNNFAPHDGYQYLVGTPGDEKRFHIASWRE